VVVYAEQSDGAKSVSVVDVGFSETVRWIYIIT